MLEAILDFSAVILGSIGLGAWMKLNRIRRNTPNNWTGPHEEFAERTRGEAAWSAVAYFGLFGAMLICVVDAFIN
jgi:hypothetical protein